MDRLDKALLILFVLRPLARQVKILEAELAPLEKECDQLTRKIAAAETLITNCNTTDTRSVT